MYVYVVFVILDRHEIDYDGVIEYDADTDDEAFVDKVNSKYENSISLAEFEVILDYFEKESFKQVLKYEKLIVA